MATSTTRPVGTIRYVGVAHADTTRPQRRQAPQPGPGEVVIIRGRTQLLTYHTCAACCKLRDNTRTIRRSVANYRGLTACEFCTANRCCKEHREPQKTIDHYIQPAAEVVT